MDVRTLVILHDIDADIKPVDNDDGWHTMRS